MTFTTLVTVQLVHAYAVRARHTGRPQDGPGRNRMLAIGVAASLALQLAVVYLPVGQRLFDTAALPVAAWAVIVPLTAASFTVVSLLNRWAARQAAPEEVLTPR